MGKKMGITELLKLFRHMWSVSVRGSREVDMEIWQECQLGTPRGLLLTSTMKLCTSEVDTTHAVITKGRVLGHS